MIAEGRRGIRLKNFNRYAENRKRAKPVPSFKLLKNQSYFPVADEL